MPQFRKPFEDTLEQFEPHKDATFTEDDVKKYGFYADYTHCWGLVDTTSKRKTFSKPIAIALEEALSKNLCDLNFNVDNIEWGEYQYTPTFFFKAISVLQPQEMNKLLFYQTSGGLLLIQNERGELSVVCPMIKVEWKPKYDTLHRKVRDDE